MWSAIAVLSSACIVLVALLLIKPSDMYRINSQQAKDISFGQALKDCLNQHKSYNCQDIKLFNTQHDGEGSWIVTEFWALSYSVGTYPGVFYDKIYLDAYGNIISEKDLD